SLVDLNDHAVELWVLTRSLIPQRQASHETSNHQLRLNADHAVVRPGHAKVSYVSRATGHNLFISGLNVSVCSDYGRDSSVEVAAHRKLLGSRFGVMIDDDHRCAIADLS